MTTLVNGASASLSAQEPATLAFPPGFVWGSGTAAYQVEGSATADGKGASIWDTFSHTPGKVRNGDTGDIAADHYRRYREDAAVLADLGHQAYRFSVSWPRVQPDGSGAVNRRGLDFYSRLVDALLENGVTPWVTLYHWDLPQALQDIGGWPNRDVAYRFAEYAAHVYEALADRVENWTTLNEPWCSAFLGYACGVHAPGHRDGAEAIHATHHLLLGHGLAVAAMRERRADRKFGITLNLHPVRPASDHPEDLDASRRVDALQNRLFLDPVLLGRYPTDVVSDVAAVTDFSHVHLGDERVIAAPLDFLGINYYTAYEVAGGEATSGDAEGGREEGPATPWVGAPGLKFMPNGLPTTAMGWDVVPDGLHDLLTRVARDYPEIPLVVTENGMAAHDYVSPEGAINDGERIAYLDGHLRAAWSAIQEGIPLRGYFVWSLMDNFEWSEGYSKRFGLLYVDYETGRRIPKRSAAWYREVIARGGLGPA